jgi:hypothetical protein
MSKKRSVIPEKLKPWTVARATFKLSHIHIQMARELGMNPKKFGSIANHEQEQWKLPLAEFIEQCYSQRFGRIEPIDCRSIEQKLETEREKKELKRQFKAQKIANSQWDAMLQSDKEKILGNVCCTSCADTTTIIDFECRLKHDGMVVTGKCKICGGTVARCLEGD